MNQYNACAIFLPYHTKDKVPRNFSVSRAEIEENRTNNSVNMQIQARPKNEDLKLDSIFKKELAKIICYICMYAEVKKRSL